MGGGGWVVKYKLKHNGSVEKPVKLWLNSLKNTKPHNFIQKSANPKHAKRFDLLFIYFVICVGMESTDWSLMENKTKTTGSFRNIDVDDTGMIFCVLLLSDFRFFFPRQIQ